MKKIRLISSLLCVLMAFGTFFGATASAQENSIAVLSVEKQYLAGSKAISNSELDKTIISGWDSMKSSIDISKYKISIDDIGDYYFNLIYNNPSYFYVKTEYQVSYNTFNNMVASIYPTYLAADNEVADYRAKFDSAVDKLMSCVNSSMSDFQKILSLHDALAMNCQYDEDYYLGKDIGDMSFTAYGALVNKNAVCQGYSLAYKLLLDKCGIDSTFASSDKLNHMWNMVKIGGKYYHVDVTWDDGRVLSNGNYYDISGSVSHVYFLQTDAEVKDSKGINDLAASVKATDSKYSTAFFRFTNPTNIFVINGAYYYINTSGDFIKRVNDNEKILYTVKTGRWNFSGNGYNSWIPAFARLARIGNYLYFNEMNNISRLSLKDGSVEKVCELNLPNNMATVGLCVLNGELLYDRQESSGNVLQLIKPDVKIDYDYRFTVKITKDGKEVTADRINGYVGDVYKISIKGVYDTDDSYDVSVLNSEIAEYDAENGTFTLLGEGPVYLVISSVKGSTQYQYLFTATDKSKVVYGDVNNDGRINMKDVLLMRKYIAGYSLNDFNSNNADVNCDGKVNMKDVLLIRKYIAGYSVELGKAA